MEHDDAPHSTPSERRGRFSENLSRLPAFKGLAIPKGEDGIIDPVRDLFRTDWPGVTNGPVVSQVKGVAICTEQAEAEWLTLAVCMIVLPFNPKPFAPVAQLLCDLGWCAHLYRKM